MKYLPHSFSCLLMVLSFLVIPVDVHAAAIAGALEPTQILNNIELVGTNISTAATTLNTELLQVKATILDPLGNSLIALSQLQTANGIMTLINGGMGGQSLIPGDPRYYVDQKGLEAVKISLGALASQQNGAYSNTLLGSLTQNFKSVSFTTKLAQVNQSSIPKTIQDATCDDTMLSNLAREDVAVEGQPLDQAAYTARKAYFYQQFCSKSANDPATAQALNQLSSARPGVALWDKWLATTVGGENEYTKTVEANQIVVAEMERRAAEATKDLDRGRGVVSQRECLVRAPSNENGEAYNPPESAPCISDVILNPSGLLSDSLTKAANAGLERLGNIQGWGSLITTLASIKQLSDGVRSVGGSINRIADGADGGSSSSGGNTSSSATISNGPVNDLANDAEKKATITDPIIALLDNDAKTLRDLEEVDQSLLADLSAYAGRLNEVKACYAEVSPDDGAANAVFANRDAIIANLRQKVADDLSKIATGKTEVQNLRNVVTSSQSTKEIMDAFTLYQRDAKNRASYTTLAERRGDYNKNKSQATGDTGSNGQLTQLYNTCVNRRNQMYQAN